jgi:hypothetical protein
VTVIKLYLPIWTRSNSDYGVSIDKLKFDIYDNRGKILAYGFTREVAHSIVGQFNRLTQELEAKE